MFKSIVTLALLIACFVAINANDTKFGGLRRLMDTEEGRKLLSWGGGNAAGRWSKRKRKKKKKRKKKGSLNVGDGWDLPPNGVIAQLTTG